jgi:adenylate cyclase
MAALPPFRRGGFLTGLALTLLVVLPLAFGAVQGLEGRLYDILLRTRGRPSSGKVILVTVTDEDFRRLGGRNPTRAEYAALLGRLWDAGASLVALDVLFLEPRGEAEDGALEAALQRVDTVLACSPGNGLFPLDRFRRQAVALGSIDLLSDRDGIFRRIPPPYFQGDGRTGPLPLALACARLLWFPGRTPEVRVEGGTLWLEDRPFRTDGTGWWIPFRGGDGSLPRLSFSEALEGGPGLARVRNRVVLVGSTRPSQHDFFSVPLPARSLRSGEMRSHTMAGVEIHGQALEALLDGEEILPLGGRPLATVWVALVLLSVLLTGWALRPFTALLLWTALLAAVAGAGLLAVRAGRPLPLLALLLSAMAFSAGSFAYHRVADYRGRREVERLFSRYVSPNVARTLLKNPGLVQLGGRRKELSILFSDIRGFTSLSERLPPERVSALLNEYFTEMTEVLFAHDGTLDKFIGDAILAFFGDPVAMKDHTARAVSCAVAMQERAAQLRERFTAEGKPPLHIGVAVNAGPVVVGNNGSRTNFAYTVIGDTVNLASRLQGLAVQDDVILPDRLRSAVPGFDKTYEWEPMEPVTVKGKAEPIPVVRIRGRRAGGPNGSHRPPKNQGE